MRDRRHRPTRNGAFAFATSPPANSASRRSTRPALQQGEASLVLAARCDQRSLNILLAGGLGTRHAASCSIPGAGVPGARVGGGLSLTTADADGRVHADRRAGGPREIVAVSDALGHGPAPTWTSSAPARPCQRDDRAPVGRRRGRRASSAADGATPVAGVNGVPASRRSTAGITRRREGRAPTRSRRATGWHSVPPGRSYRVSAFRPDFSDGNIVAGRPQLQQPGRRGRHHVPRRQRPVSPARCSTMTA